MGKGVEARGHGEGGGKGVGEASSSPLPSPPSLPPLPGGAYTCPARSPSINRIPVRARGTYSYTRPYLTSGHSGSRANLILMKVIGGSSDEPPGPLTSLDVISKKILTKGQVVICE